MQIPIPRAIARRLPKASQSASPCLLERILSSLHFFRLLVVLLPPKANAAKVRGLGYCFSHLAHSYHSRFSRENELGRMRIDVRGCRCIHHHYLAFITITMRTSPSPFIHAVIIIAISRALVTLLLRRYMDEFVDTLLREHNIFHLDLAPLPKRHALEVALLTPQPL